MPIRSSESEISLDQNALQRVRSRVLEIIDTGGSGLVQLTVGLMAVTILVTCAGCGESEAKQKPRRLIADSGVSAEIVNVESSEKLPVNTVSYTEPTEAASEDVEFEPDLNNPEHVKMLMASLKHESREARKLSTETDDATEKRRYSLMARRYADMAQNHKEHIAAANALNGEIPEKDDPRYETARMGAELRLYIAKAFRRDASQALAVAQTQNEKASIRLASAQRGNQQATEELYRLAGLSAPEEGK